MSQNLKGLNLTKQNVQILFKSLCLLFLLLLFSGCDDSTSEEEKISYVKFYNASSNAPEIRLSLTYQDDDSEIYGNVEYGESISTTELLPRTYFVEFEWEEDSDEYELVFEQDNQFSGDKVTFFVLAGDFNSPDLLTFEYEHENSELSDDTDEDNFSLRAINTVDNSAGVDIYISKDDETFEESQLIGDIFYGGMSDNSYFELDSYKIYLTQTGSTEVILETKEYNFAANINYIISIVENSGPGTGLYNIDILTTGNFVTNYSDVNSGAELRFFNGIRSHELLPSYNGNIDIELIGTSVNQTISNINKGTSSETIPLLANDYSINLNDSVSNELLSENFFVSLDNNDDYTVFLYLNEVTEEIEDEPDVTKVYLNTLPVTNSNRDSLYDHQINVINLIQDDRFDDVDVYFVRSNETVSTADFSTSTQLAQSRIITIPNNTYDINLITKVDGSELLLHFQTVTLDEDNGDYFLVLEVDETSSTGYTATFIPQSD